MILSIRALILINGGTKPGITILRLTVRSRLLSSRSTHAYTDGRRLPSMLLLITTTNLNTQGYKMSYDYEAITTFFKPTIWSEDVSQFIAILRRKLKNRSKANSVWYRGMIGNHSRSLLKVRLDILNTISDLADLSAECQTGEYIKVIYLARHGHGKCLSSFGPFFSMSTSTHIDNPGEHNIIHEQYPTWEQVSSPLPTPEPTHDYSASTNKRPKKSIHPTMQVLPRQVSQKRWK